MPRPNNLKDKLLSAFLALPLIFVILLLVRGPQGSDQTENSKESPAVSIPVAQIKDKESPLAEAIKDIITIDNKPELFEYVQIVDGCGIHFQGACVNVRTSPDSTSKVAYKLRSGVILKVKDKITADGRDWYEVYFDEWLRYPERAASRMYVAAEFVKPFRDEGTREVRDERATGGSKRITIDRSEQMLYAYEDDVLFMKEKVSTGIELTPTPRGNFTVYKKTPSRYMQGPIPGISTHYYDLPGVPWNLYFSQEGAVIHGAYWHDSFGKKWSNGCVNLPIESAEKLYKWADVGTKILVRD
jgi:hypothetical protein